MPKRRFKPVKPSKKITKKQLLIPPVMIGVATLAGIIIMQFNPPPPVLDICLKAHNRDKFNLYPVIQIFVDGKQKLLPDTVGNETKEGKNCLHLIHTDETGEHIHVQYIRPIRLSMDDFMNIYSKDNKTIPVVDNNTKPFTEEVLNLDQYNIQYSYYSENNEFTKVSNSTLMPPFTKDMVVKMELKSKENINRSILENFEY